MAPTVGRRGQGSRRRGEPSSPTPSG